MEIKGLYKRENGVWYLRLPGNKRHSLDTTKKIVAIERAKPIKDKYDIYLQTNDRRYLPENLSLRFSEAIKKYLIYSEAQGRSFETINNHRKRLDLAKRFFGDISINKLSEENVYEFINKRRNELNSPTSLRNDLVSLKAMLNYCKKNLRIIRYHPFDVIPIKQVNLNPVYLSTQDVEKLFKWKPLEDQKKWLKWFIQLALSSGFRRGELTRLRWQDIDKNKRMITVTGKTGIRYFPLTSDIRKILSRHEASDFNNLKDIEFNEDMYVFHKQLPPYDKFDVDTITLYVKSVFRECNLSEKYTLHSLRHTFGAHYYKKTRNLEILQKLMGHRNISTTQIYAHVTVDPEDVEGNLTYMGAETAFEKSLEEEEFSLYHFLKWNKRVE